MTSAGKGALALCAVAGLLTGLGAVVSTQWMAAPAQSDGHPVPGAEAPGFKLPQLDGGDVALEELRGKVVYVNLWATWCGPCRSEAPSLQRLYAEFEDDGFVILAVSVDSAEDVEKVREFREELGLTFPILLDPERVAPSRYGTLKYPETFLVDAEGNLVESYLGPRNWDEPKYARTIARVLARREGGVDGPGGD